MSLVRTHGGQRCGERQAAAGQRSRDAILAAVRSYHARHGYFPTLREIGEAVGLSSSSTVWGHLQTLEQQGHLRSKPVQRGYELTGDSLHAAVSEFLRQWDEDEMVDDDVAAFIGRVRRLL